MRGYETHATVAADGTLKIVAPEEFADQEVEVWILPKRSATAERVAAWERLCRRIQPRVAREQITDEDIQREIEAVRARD